MAIQQVASSNSNGIMSFLFQDDGSVDGTVLEGPGFAKTLHQLLGGHDHAETADGELAEDPATAQKDETEAAAAPLTATLDSLVRNFDSPKHDAKLPVEAGSQSETASAELEPSFWELAPFATNTAPREHASLKDAAVELEGNSELDASPTATPAPAVPAFGNGIAHVIELARDAAQLTSELTQQPAQPLPAPLQSTRGRTAPPSGKVLPQGLRNAPFLLNAATAGAKATQAANTFDATLPLVGNETTVSNAFFADLASFNADSSPQQGATPQQQQSQVQGLQALHPQSPLANLPKAANADAAPANPLPHQSQHLAGTDAWFQDLGARVDWLKDMKVDKAELQLHPAELGLLEIHISAGDDGAMVSFITHNTEARQLIEDSMPRLRELLANQGMQLGQSQVSQHSEGQRREHSLHANHGGATRDTAAADEPAPARRRAYVADPNRIDHYV